jgi:predicted Rossmann-fold nucleotide-binding protein
MDELFEALTLIQTGKIDRLPVVLIGRDYWQPVVALLRQLEHEAMIDADDRQLITVVDDANEAACHIQQRVAARLGSDQPGGKSARWLAAFSRVWSMRGVSRVGQAVR